MLITRRLGCTALLALVFLTACVGGATVATPATATVTASPPPTATVTTAPTPTATTPAAPAATATATGTPTAATPRAAVSASPATPPRPAAANGTPPAAPAPVFPTQPRGLGQPTARTAHYAFFDPEGAHGATIAPLAAEAEAIYAYVADRTGLRATEPIAVVVQTQSPSECAARGIAYRDRESPRIGIFVGPGVQAAQLRLVLAHETAHVLHFPFVVGGIDPTLVEGFANWASLRYWAEWQGLATFDEAVRGYLAAGRFVAVDDPPADCTIAGRDVIYNERASFVGYLIATYGRERFLAASGTTVPTRRATLPQIADYEGVYGKSFAALLDEWLAAVKA